MPVISDLALLVLFVVFVLVAYLIVYNYFGSKFKYQFKKKLIVVMGIILAINLTVAIAVYVVLTFFPPLTMNNVYSQPSFEAKVVEIANQSMTLELTDNTLYSKGELVIAPLDTTLVDSLNDFSIGENIIVYYSGDVMESYPARIAEVYAYFRRD